MADAKIVQEWIVKADDDLAFVNSILNDTTFFAQVCFHIHQAAEKYLKAKAAVERIADRVKVTLGKSVSRERP